jgi:hypothetical protein
MSLPALAAISGDGLARSYALGHRSYPAIDIWEWVRADESCVEACEA